MTEAAVAPTNRDSERPPFWRDVRAIAWAAQIAVVSVVGGLLYWLWQNFQNNSKKSGIPTGLDYLQQPAGFPIAGSSFRTSQSVWDATIIGIRNTLYVAVVGILLATVLGILIGIARLSGNWLISRAAAVYVEALRNTPLLAIVIFAYLALVLSVLPTISDAWQLGDFIVISNRAAALPWFEGSPWPIVAGGALAFFAAYIVIRWRRESADRLGRSAQEVRWAFPAAVVTFTAVWIVSGQTITKPVLDGRRLSGGMEISPEFLALLVALVLYTASHIAEIVRGSIQAVHRGQAEAADALALSGTQRMRYVVLPQAMRIAVPPLGNQYLNLFKNSSLGVVISYYELTKVTRTTVANGQPAVPAFAVVMLIYLIGSIIISRSVNIANRRLEVVGR